MGRKKKDKKPLVFDSVQIQYQPQVEREWLNLLSDWVILELNKQIKGGQEKE